MPQTRRNISTLSLAFLVLSFCILGCKQFSRPEPKWPKSKVLSNNEDHPSRVLSDGTFIFYVTGGTVASQNEHTNNIKKIKIADGSVSVLVEGGERIPNEAIALDDKFLYWSDGGNILRVPKGGGQSEVVVANVAQPSEMLVDKDNLYWMIWVGEGSSAAPLMMAPKAAGGVARAISPPQPGASGFCISNDSVFWMAHAGINKVSKAGGEVTLVYPNPNPNGLMDGLQQDADNFYFKRSAERGRTALMKLAKAGGDPIEIAPSISLTMEFVADGTSVYYFDLEKGYGSFGPVSLRRVASSGGEPVTLDTGGAGWINYLAADDKQVYFTDIARVYALPK